MFFLFIFITILLCCCFFFFFKDTATTEIYPLSLPAALPFWLYVWLDFALTVNQPFDRSLPHVGPWFARVAARPSAGRSKHLLQDSQSR